MLQRANKCALIILAALIILVFFLNDGQHVIGYQPRSMHEWRQGDCMAYARNYYERNLSFLNPCFYNLIVKDGASVSELPIIYYLSAKIFHFVGVQYWVVRGLTFLCYLVGLFYLYRCLQFWIKSNLAAIFPVILLATTPYYYYYALNYLPNVPAISFSFVGLYYLLRYEQVKRITYVVLGTGAFVLSLLLKPTDGGLLWCAYVGVTGVRFLQRKQDIRIWPFIVSTAAVLLSLLAWVKYVNWYNASHNNTINLIGIYPIWDMSRADINGTLGRMATYWNNCYQQKYILYFLLFLLIVYIVKWRSLNKFLRLFTLFTILGGLAYDVLWFKAFGDLDYYQLINVLPPLFLIITVLEYYTHKVLPKLNNLKGYSVSFIGCLIMFVSIVHNKNVQYDRYHNTFFVSKQDHVFGIEPWLRSHGISSRDTIMSIPDNTPNVTLLACGNIGYSHFFENDSITLSFLKGHHVKYLLVTDTGYLHHAFYMPYMKKLYGVYKDIYIFDQRE